MLTNKTYSRTTDTGAAIAVTCLASPIGNLVVTAIGGEVVDVQYLGIESTAFVMITNNVMEVEPKGYRDMLDIRTSNAVREYKAVKEFTLLASKVAKGDKMLQLLDTFKTSRPAGRKFMTQMINNKLGKGVKQ